MTLSQPAPASLAPGYKLDRYELLCPIAEGGMAVVWVARQTGKHGFEKLVAVKMILPKFAADIAFQKMFRDEARIASRIEHSNAAQILDVGEQQDMTYLVMEYVDGDALSSIHRTLKKQNEVIPPGVILRVMADACGALHAAHELRDGEGALLGVVHRDVSPQNVLVSTKGLAKIIDFGIAKARDRIAGDTSAGQVKGKVRYMAPEQAMGRPIDRRADIWAVGAILYHLLSGKPPYDGENDVQTLMALTSGMPPLPLPPNVPALVAAVVKRALKPAPDARYSTAAEMQEAIEEAMVHSKLSTSVAGVASFLGHHVNDRAQKRKQAIALGLKAAAERDRVAEVMRSNTEVAAGGLSDPGVPRSSGNILAVTGSHPITGGGNSAPGSGTLGSAAFGLSVGKPSRNRALLLGGGAAAAAAIAGVVFLATHGPGSAGVSATVSSPSVVDRASGVDKAPASKPALEHAVEAPSAGSNVQPAPATVPGEGGKRAQDEIPTLAASALPKAAAPAYSPPVVEAPHPRPVYTPPPAPPPKPAAGPTPKKRIDDGF